MKLRVVVTGLVVLTLAVGAHSEARRAEQQAEPGRSAWDGVYNHAQLERGKSAYEELCSSCHGYELTGGEEAPPLMGTSFMSNWNGLTVGDLFERIRTSMPPDGTRTLPRQTIADVITQILSTNRFPVGDAELPTQTEALRQIRIEIR